MVTSDKRLVGDNARGMKNLREIRRATGLNQAEFAAIIPIAHATLRGIETGSKGFSNDLVQKIARRVGCGWRRVANGQPFELTMNRIGSNDLYTNEWFRYWDQVQRRKQCFQPIVGALSRTVEAALEAACAQDVDRVVNADQMAEQSFDSADHLVDRIFLIFEQLFEDPTVLEKIYEGTDRERMDFYFGPSSANEGLKKRVDQAKRKYRENYQM